MFGDREPASLSSPFLPENNTLTTTLLDPAIAEDPVLPRY